GRHLCLPTSATRHWQGWRGVNCPLPVSSSSSVTSWHSNRSDREAEVCQQVSRGRKGWRATGLRGGSAGTALISVRWVHPDNQQSRHGCSESNISGLTRHFLRERPRSAVMAVGHT